MRPYLLLTPGPLTTSESVKHAMMSDWCTWDEDYNIGIVEVIRKKLVDIASSTPEDYTAVLMQGEAVVFVWRLLLELLYVHKIICLWLQTVLTVSVWE